MINNPSNSKDFHLKDPETKNQFRETIYAAVCHGIPILN